MAVSTERKDATNWDQARDRIDTGKTGDKVAVDDPAAAPLGTDAEAGGETTPPDAIDRSTVAQEQRPAVAERDPDLKGGVPDRRPAWMVAAVVGVLVVAVLIGLAVVA